MVKTWESYSKELKDLLAELQLDIQKIIGEKTIGVYVHGSLAMGGFNPNSSDIDLIIVIEKPLTTKTKKELAHLFLMYSNRPYPLEVSMLTIQQLKNWQFPTPYEFHYSEYWRERYEKELKESTSIYLNADEKKDSDLAAHLTVLQHRGICLNGKPIQQTFPTVPKEDYLLSILGDYEDCLKNFLLDPVYCILNSIRVYWYLKEGTIPSKPEAGNWGAATLPGDYQKVINQAVYAYENEKMNAAFIENDLMEIRDFLKRNIEELLTAR